MKEELLPDNYYKVVLSSDFDTFQEAVEHCVKVESELQCTKMGVVILFVTKWTEMEMLPWYETQYVLDGVTYDNWNFELECSEDYETFREETHFVEWTKPLELDTKTRLSILYAPDYTLEDAKHYLEVFGCPEKHPYSLLNIKLI